MGRVFAAAYLVPSLALLGVVLLSPVVYALWFSLQEIDYGAAAGFVGLANFSALLADPNLPPMLGRSFGQFASPACLRISGSCTPGKATSSSAHRTERNPNMATAANFTMAEVEHLLQPGEIDPDLIVTPGIFPREPGARAGPYKRIEEHTTRMRPGSVTARWRC